MIPIGMASAIPSPIAWTAADAAPSGSFYPVRRATGAVAPNETPIATA